MVKFTKLTGNGNDFIVFDNLDNSIDSFINSRFVKKITARRFSIGADGVIFISKSDKADFHWRFFNSDGTEADMCGNGARCVARYAYNNGLAQKTMKFETGAGIIEAYIIDDTDVKVQLTNPHSLEVDNSITIDGIEYTYSFINTGVPHIVLYVDNIDKVDVKGLGSKLRYHSNFSPNGVNVNFISVVSPTELIIRTYERGVEDETLACGTGSTAAALVSIAKGIVTSPVRLKTASDRYLTVYREVDNVYLEGEARVVYNGTLGSSAYEY